MLQIAYRSLSQAQALWRFKHFQEGIGDVEDDLSFDNW